MEAAFREGDAVRVLDGPFRDFVGVVAVAHADADPIKVRITISGTETVQGIPSYWLERVQ